jgi:hypothetical protein
MTWFLALQPLNEPKDPGPDETGAAQCVFDVVATKAPSATFEREVLAVLELAGVGRIGVSLFASSQTVIPSPLAAPMLVVRATGGLAPLGTHNEGAAALRRPGAQILVRASTYAAAAAMAQAAYDALVALRNHEVVA